MLKTKITVFPKTQEKNILVVLTYYPGQFDFFFGEHMTNPPQALVVPGAVVRPHSYKSMFEKNIFTLFVPVI